MAMTEASPVRAERAPSALPKLGRDAILPPMPRLLEFLRARSYRAGRVRLASGRESDFFIDVKQTALLAEGHALLGARLLDTIAGQLGPVDAVAGVVLGGCPLASAVAAQSFARGQSVDAVYVRKAAKDHGTQKLVEGASCLAPGARVAVVEDVVTTGGSTLAALDVLRAEDLEVAGVVAVVDRLEGGADAIRALGVPFVALFDRSDFVDLAGHTASGPPGAS